jgi:hypothetical protein
MADDALISVVFQPNRAPLTMSELSDVTLLYQKRGGVAANVTDISNLLAELQIATPMGTTVFDIIDEVLASAFAPGSRQLSCYLPLEKVVELLELLKSMYLTFEAEQDRRGTQSIVNLRQTRRSRTLTAEEILQAGGDIGENKEKPPRSLSRAVESIRSSFMKPKMSLTEVPAEEEDSDTEEEEFFDLPVRKKRSDSTDARLEHSISFSFSKSHRSKSERKHFADLTVSSSFDDAVATPKTSLAGPTSATAESVMQMMGAMWFESTETSEQEEHRPPRGSTSRQSVRDQCRAEDCRHLNEVAAAISSHLSNMCGYPPRWNFQKCLLLHVMDLRSQLNVLRSSEIVENCIAKRMDCLSHHSIRSHVPSALLDRSLLTAPDFAHIVTHHGLVMSDLARTLKRMQKVCSVLRRQKSTGEFSLSTTEEAVQAHLDTSSGTKLAIALRRAVSQAEREKQSRDHQIDTLFADVDQMTKPQPHPPTVKAAHSMPPLTPKPANRTAQRKQQRKPHPPTEERKKVASATPRPAIVVPSRPSTARTSRAPLAPRSVSDVPLMERPSSTLLSSFFEDAGAAALMAFAVNDQESAHLKMVREWTRPSSAAAATITTMAATSPAMAPAGRRPLSARKATTPLEVPVPSPQPPSAAAAADGQCARSEAVFSVVRRSSSFTARGAAQPLSEPPRLADADNDEEIDISAACEIGTSSASAAHAKRLAAAWTICRFFFRIRSVKLRDLFKTLGSRLNHLVDDAPLVQAMLRAKIGRKAALGHFHSRLLAASLVLQRIGRGFLARSSLRQLHRPRWKALSGPSRRIQAAGRGYVARRAMSEALEDKHESNLLDAIITQNIRHNQNQHLVLTSHLRQPESPLPRSRKSSAADEDAQLDQLLEQLAPDRFLPKTSSNLSSRCSTPQPFAALETVDSFDDFPVMTSFELPATPAAVSRKASHDTIIVTQSPLGKAPAASAFCDTDALHAAIDAAAMEFDHLGCNSMSSLRSNSNSTSQSHRKRLLLSLETKDDLVGTLERALGELDESNCESDAGRPIDLKSGDSEQVQIVTFAVPTTLEKNETATWHSLSKTPSSNSATFGNQPGDSLMMHSHSHSSPKGTEKQLAHVNRKKSLVTTVQHSFLVLIQAVARGFRARKKQGRLWRRALNRNALRVLFRVCRGYRARMKFGMLHRSLVESKEEMLQWEKRHEAAKLLQRVHRRIQARFLVGQMKDDVRNAIRFRVELEQTE